MNVIIAGGRDVTDFDLVERAVNNSGFEIEQVVSGGAKGVDTLAVLYAQKYNKHLALFMADWDRHGRKAGPIRNGQMAEYADALIAVWDGKSKGTKNMIDQATAKGLKVYIERTDQPTALDI